LDNGKEKFRAHKPEQELVMPAVKEERNSLFERI